MTINRAPADRTFPPPDLSVGSVSFWLTLRSSLWCVALLAGTIRYCPRGGESPPSRGGVTQLRRLHPLDLTPAEARRLQNELAPRVAQGPPLDLGGVRYVAGADVSTEGEMAYATVVVLDFPGLSVVEVRGHEERLAFPYVPGLLSFREIPSLYGALGKVRTPVDAVVFDAHGRAHPRRMGLASHLGLYVDVPAVGCAKTRLVGEYEEPEVEKGSTSELWHGGEVVGEVVRTRTGVSPVFVSVGNGVDLPGAVELVLALCPRYRLPETTRRAHEAANRLRRGEGFAGFGA